MNIGQLKKDLSLSPKEYIESLNRKEIIETKNAYKNLYSSDNIDNKKDQEGNNNPNENGNSISSGINIIKINLDSLEFELNE